MTRPRAIATAFIFAVSESLGQTISDPLSSPPPGEEKGGSGSYSLSTFIYLEQHARDYANPNVTANRGWLHLEGRYNYEALKTGSIWLGYNFRAGEKLKLEATPMLGGAFGDSTGIAPGYNISLTYKQFELTAQGEYFFDSGNQADDFFYNWTELSCAPTGWFRIGVAVERTKVVRTNSDVRRGPFIGFTRDKVDFTTYWLGPGSNESAFVFAVTVSF
jgi:hypothetical protein